MDRSGRSAKGGTQGLIVAVCAARIHGERFLDMTNDREEVSRCSRVSIGEVAGQVMNRHNCGDCARRTWNMRIWRRARRLIKRKNANRAPQICCSSDSRDLLVSVWQSQSLSPTTKPWSLYCRSRPACVRCILSPSLLTTAMRCSKSSES